MSRFSQVSAFAAVFLLTLPLAFRNVAVADEVRAPFVTALADDDDTRGDWIGSYGTYAYILCGMRAPHSLYGGKGWPVQFSVATGDPEDDPRAWRSSAPAQRDRSVLMEPNGLRRTPAAFDDHGEARALGQGPDLHIRISIPGGPFLLSLYFFEVDWIQYRAYRIRIFADSQQDAPLLETHADNFFKGKYKRFVVIGPTELLVVIERGQSPNAQVSGIFLDELGFPDMEQFDRTVDREITEGTSGSLAVEPAARAAESALAGLIGAPDSQSAAQDYVRNEREFLLAMKGYETTQPTRYYAELDRIWTPTEERIGRALRVLEASPYHVDVMLLRYYVSRARLDYQDARDTAREIAYSLFDRSRSSEQPWIREARYLRQYATALLKEGRRAEAEPFLRAYVRFCLERERPEQSRESLLSIGQLALKASVPTPVAQALTKWEDQHGRLSTKDRLLLGSLYYVAGRNEEAFRVLESVEPEMKGGSQHRWCLVAMATALLRTDRLTEARAVIQRLEADYPGKPEVGEAKYRLGVYYFDKRHLDQAQKCFALLMVSTESEVLQAMCSEYVERIAHLQSIREQVSRND